MLNNNEQIETSYCCKIGNRLPYEELTKNTILSFLKT